MQVLTYEVEGWGVGELYLDGGRLLHHELPRTDTSRGLTPRHGPAGRGDPPDEDRRRGVGRHNPQRQVSRAAVPRGLTPGHGRNGLVRRMEAYFAGERVAFDDVRLDLSRATSFQRALVDALRGVPYGEVVTYGELAALAGRPTAPRAAGTFCAGNRVPLVVPCHRVVAANAIGGYGSLGAAYKRRLLALEGVVA